MADQKAWMRKPNTVNKMGFPCLSYSKAVDFINSGNSCLVEVEQQRQISLAPRYIGQLDVGIREYLDADILKYSDELDGIVVCYKQVQCLETSGCINDEAPLVHFTVKVKYIVFRPRVGAKLKGVVNRVGHGHYGCLVHGCFNGSVHKLKIDVAKLSNKIIKKISNIDVGSEFIFRITRFDVHNDLLSIKGKIDQEDIQHIKNPDNKEVEIKEEYDSFAKTDNLSLHTNKSCKDDTSLNGAVGISFSNHNEIESPDNMVKDENISNKKKKRKDKNHGSKRRHSEVTQSVKTKNETEYGINSNKHIVSKKKKK